MKINYVRNCNIIFLKEIIEIPSDHNYFPHATHELTLAANSFWKSSHGCFIPSPEHIPVIKGIIGKSIKFDTFSFSANRDIILYDDRLLIRTSYRDIGKSKSRGLSFKPKLNLTIWAKHIEILGSLKDEIKKAMMCGVFESRDFGESNE